MSICRTAFQIVRFVEGFALRSKHVQAIAFLSPRLASDHACYTFLLERFMFGSRLLFAA